MSKVVRNIWVIQKIMWDRRNSYVYASNGNIYQYEEEAMTAAMWWGFEVDQNRSSAAYSGLFTRQVQHLSKNEVITTAQLLNYVCNL